MCPTSGSVARSSPWTLLRRTGWALIAVGIVLLAYVGWQFYGTNWVARRAQHHVVAEVQRQWSSGDHRPVRTSHGTVGALLRIPRFGSGWVQPIIEGTSDDALAAGVGHYTGTAGPGGRGNIALAGHRVTHGEPFHDLPDLRPGDQVIIETATTVYTYVLDTGGDTPALPFTATWVLEPQPHDPDPAGISPASDQHRLITLTTCSELFHTDNRLVVFGHLAFQRHRT